MDEAITEFRKAIEIQPDDAEAHNDLGITLQAKGQLDEAIAEYRKALQIQPDDADGHCNLGIALQDKGQLDEAITEYRKALQIQPDDAEARINLGFTLDLAERDALLPVILRGEAAPADAAQQVRFAGLLPTKQAALCDRVALLRRRLHRRAGAGERPVVLRPLQRRLRRRPRRLWSGRGRREYRREGARPLAQARHWTGCGPTWRCGRRRPRR